MGLSIDLTYLGASDAGTATVGEITLLLVRDGHIAGTIGNVDSQLDWPLKPGASIQSGAGVFADFFQCKRRSAEGQHKYFDTAVAPGDYQLVAVAHVFSTEESVALAQAVPPWYQLDESRRDPGGIYAPESYDCTRLEATATTVRGCLPNVAPAATLDNGRGSISVRYDPSALVAPFDTTLVSKQVSVTLAAWRCSRGCPTPPPCKQAPMGRRSCRGSHPMAPRCASSRARDWRTCFNGKPRTRTPLCRCAKWSDLRRSHWRACCRTTVIGARPRSS